LIGVKNNQLMLAQAVQAQFEPALREQEQTALDQKVRIDKGHARSHPGSRPGKGSIKLKRKRARWNDEFMAQLLGCTLPDHKAPPPAPTARNWWGG
jgi:hypothetical protein